MSTLPFEVRCGLKSLKKQLADAEDEQNQLFAKLYKIELGKTNLIMDLQVSVEYIDYLNDLIEEKKAKKSKMVETMATYGRDGSTTYEPDDTAIERQDSTETELDCQ